jgi:Putative holin
MMLVGSAVGFVLGVTATLLIRADIRPDGVMAAVLGLPTVLGIALIVSSSSRWVTALGAFTLAIAPGWFAVLVLNQVVYGA